MASPCYAAEREEKLLIGRTPLLAVGLWLALAGGARAAAIDVGFRPQNGTVDTSTEWAVEILSDEPIGSFGIYIPNALYPTGFTSWEDTPVIGLPGVRATLVAVDAWGGAPVAFDATWFGLAPGVLINGAATTWIEWWPEWRAVGMLHGVTRAEIMAGEGVESGLWADAMGNPIPATDVTYVTPEPRALMLLGLGLCALALLRYSRV